MAIALILAAGRGERLGAAGPKALAELAGRSLLAWSLDIMRAVGSLEEIVVALPPGAPSPAGTTGVQGGAVRSASVRLALAAAADGDPGEAIVVHDAARPLVTVELVERAIAALAGEGVDAAIAAAPVSDTIKRVRRGAGWAEPAGARGSAESAGARGGSEGGGSGAPAGGVVVETLDRRELWAVQTPQVFRRGALERALDVPDDVLAEATDDAWLIERAGGKVLVVGASPENLKITTQLDLAVAELLLARRAAV